MAIIKSSSEHLTLNADGANKDIKFQANGVEKASIDSAGNFTSTTIDATKLTGNLPAIDGSSLTNLPLDTNTPSFMASLSGTQWVSNNTWTLVDYTTELVDTDSAYDTTNKRFTVPSGKAGKYLLFASLSLYGGGSTQLWNSNMRLRVNGSSLSYSQYGNNFDGNYINNITASTQVVVDLSVGDYVDVQGLVERISASPGFLSGGSVFGGFKLL